MEQIDTYKSHVQPICVGSIWMCIFHVERVETTSMKNVNTKYLVLKHLFECKSILEEKWYVKLGNE